MKPHRLLYAVALIPALMGHAQTAAIPVIPPHQTYLDSTGSPCSGCSLYSYAAGTTTPKATYSDASLGTPNPNPVVLGVDGGAQIWLGSGAYKLILKDTGGGTVWTSDNVLGGLQYLPSNGGTMTGTLNGTSAAFSGAVTVGGNLPVTGVIQGGAVASTAALTSGFTSSQGATAKTVVVSGFNSGSNLGGGTFQWMASGFTPPATFTATFANNTADGGGHTSIMTVSGLSGTLQLGQTIIPATTGFTPTHIVSINSSGNYITDVSQTASGISAVATLVDNCINFAPSNDATGASGVWQRMGGYNQPITPEMCGAKGDGTTDDTTAFRNGLSLLQWEAQQNMYGKFEGAGNTYLLSKRLFLPVGTIAGGSCASSGGPSTGGDNWEVTAKGKMTLKQNSNDEPILDWMGPCRTASRNAKISHIKFTWTTQQATSCVWNYNSPNSSIFTAPYNQNCHSTGIMFDQQGDSQFGPNAWHVSDVEFDNGAMGIGPSPEQYFNNYAFALWAIEMDNIRGNNNMTGPYILAGGIGNAGSTRGILRNFYAQSAGIYNNWRVQNDAGLSSFSQPCAVVLRQGVTWNLESVEWNVGSNCQMFVVGMNNLEINRARIEATHCTFGGANIFTFSSTTNIAINGLENKSFHPDLPTNTFCNLLQPYQAQVHVKDIDLDTDFASSASGTMTQSGTAITFSSGTLQGALQNGATITGSGITTETISGLSGLTATGSVSQTISSPTAFSAANPATGGMYVCKTNGPNNANISFTGSQTATTITWTGGGAPVVGAKVNSNGFKEETITAVAMPSITVDQSQTIPAASTFSATSYSNLTGQCIFEGGLIANATTHEFGYQGGPPYPGALNYGFVDHQQITFGFTGLNASQTATAMSTGVGEGTWRAPRDGYIVRIEVYNSANITAGTLQLTPFVTSQFTPPGNTNVTAGLNPGVTSGTYTYRVASPVVDVNVPTQTINGTSYLTSHFFAGDKIGVNVSTDSGFLPISQNVTVKLTVVYM